MPQRLELVTLRQLRAVAAVAAGGSVTAAARALNLSQPAITVQLRNLEERVGLALIQRTADGMMLTDAGREILRLSERIAAATADCERTLDMMAGRNGGRVAVGCVSTAKYFIPFAIAAFSRENANMDIRLSIGNRQEIMQAMRTYDLDFAIMGRPPPDVAVEKHYIGDHPHVIVAAPGHPLARRAGLAVADLAQEVFLTREIGSGTRMLMEGLFEASRLTPVIGMEFASNESIKQGVLAGLGIAFISAHTVATELDEGRLVALRVAGLPVIRHWHVVRRSDKILLPPAKAAFDFMVEQVANFLPRSPLPAAA